MTIICVRNGIMAVDSLISADGLKTGSLKKWRAVKDDVGGGFVAGCGLCSHAIELIEKIAEYGIPTHCPSIDKSVSAFWLKANGKLHIVENGGSYCPDGEFFAEGSGREFAYGAMAMGASAYQAAKLTCEHKLGCGGPVHLLDVSHAKTLALMDLIA